MTNAGTDLHSGLAGLAEAIFLLGQMDNLDVEFAADGCGVSHCRA